MAVCSTPSLSVPAGLLEETAELTAAAVAKLRLILPMQRSAGRRRFRYNPCKTDRTLGRWTTWRTKRCDCCVGGGREMLYDVSHISSEYWLGVREKERKF